MIAILGREYLLSQAEIESVASNFQHLNQFASRFDSTEAVSINRFGGVVKIADELFRLPIKPTALLKSKLVRQLQQRLGSPSGKVSFGCSLYLKNPDLKSHLGRLGLDLKKALRLSGKKARYIAPKSGVVLSAAQIKFNRLVDSGYELLIIDADNQLIVAKTVQVQDIDSYSRRDYGRPCRNMTIGMLPPKLAQIMINLAQVNSQSPIFDPFCGSGVILQEGLLLGYDVIGSDINPKMAACAKNNLDWLQQSYPIAKHYSVTVQDALKLTDMPPKAVIVSEGFLGQPLKDYPSDDQLSHLRQALSQLYLSFLQTVAGFNCPITIVISLPVWRINAYKLAFLDIFDQITALGYTIKRFSRADTNDLVYLRPNQYVGRQLLVIKKVKNYVQD